MRNAAPFIASPVRRLLAAAVDLFVLLFFMIFGIALVGEARTSTHIVTALAIYGIYHAAFLLILEGATPGLRALDMRMVSVRGASALSAGQIFVRSAFRPALLYGIGWVAVKIAPAPGMLFSIIFSPALLELGMMFTMPTRQTLTDLACGTLVVNAPPPEPHRAPAGPMYSVADAEFGVRPPR